jgi:hemerythrin-like metal-binding protein
MACVCPITPIGEAAVLTWESSHALNHDAIDKQHIGMVELANRVLDAHAGRAGNELIAAIRALIDHSAEHFLFEERLMSETRYPRTQAHSEHHGMLLAELHRFCERLLSEGRHLTRERTAEFLSGWFASHVNDFDRDLASHLARAVAGTPGE